jgi:hypothetical protein
MTDKKWDWLQLREEYRTTTCKLKDLSQDGSADPDRLKELPPYSYLKLVSHQEKWRLLRQQYQLEERQKQISAYLPVSAGEIQAGAGGMIETPTGVPYELRNSKFQQQYEKSSQDTELLALKREIALVNARLLQLADKLGTGEAAENWLTLKSLMNDFVRAQKTQDPNAFAIFEEIRSLIYKGAEDTRLWADITALQEHLRKLVESERRRLVELKQYVTSEDATALINALLEAVKRNVEQKQLTRIVGDFSKFSGGRY